MPEKTQSNQMKRSASVIFNANLSVTLALYPSVIETALKLVLREPKSGKEYEYVFIPQKVADRLREYALEVCNSPNDRIFPISYEAARIMVIKSGKMVGVKLRPHDLHRHSATYASRSGVPIEIIRKVILRHANLSTTKSFNYILPEF